MTLLEKLSQTKLPLVPYLPEIVENLNRQGRLILHAEPGSGKSTLVPLALLENPGSIIMLEPRRIAAIGIAARMAELLEEPVGKTVGYAVRMERRTSAATRIEVLTEGLLVRRLQTNPELPGVSTIIFDEFHERSLFTDLSFALVLDLCRIKPDLKILIMSATMDCTAIAGRIHETEGRTGPNRVPMLDYPGKLFPIETEYRPPKMGESPVQACARTLRSLLQETAAAAPSAILAFLPGRREIQGVAELLSDLGPEIEVLPLHGSLSLAEQRRVLKGSEKGTARIILATNIAETSLTVPGVSVVVDTGLVRLQRYHLRTGMDRLSLELASTQAVDQRRGRAGRLGPGRCIRLWSPQEVRPAATEPEIRRLDLASLVLECALWGAPDPEALPWLEVPPRPAWEASRGLLLDMGAIDREGRATELGKQLAHLALHPRLAMLALAGKEQGNADLGALLAALLSERDPSGIENDADIGLRLEALSEPVNQGRYAAVLELYFDILRRLKMETSPDETGSGVLKDFSKVSPAKVSLTNKSAERAGELLAKAFPDRICRRQENGSFRFISGREAFIRGRLAKAEWLVAADADAGERNGAIYLAAPISNETALSILSPHFEREVSVVWKGLIPKARVSTRAGRLLIQEEQRPCSKHEASTALAALIKTQGLEILPWDETAEAYPGSFRIREQDTPRKLLDRIRYYTKQVSLGAEETMFSQWINENLIAEVESWLTPFIWNGEAVSDGPVLTAVDLYLALKERLGWATLQVMNREVPPLFISPAGTAHPIDYHSGEPLVSLKIQEVYGMAETPLIMGQPLTFELLSPAGRPIQVTKDLGRFWKGSYAEVRKEMRGRYPKHDWPEDPSHAQPHTRVFKS